MEKGPSLWILPLDSIYCEGRKVKNEIFDETKFRKRLKTFGKRDSTIDQYARELRNIPLHVLEDIKAVNKWLNDQGFETSRRALVGSAVRAYYRYVLDQDDKALLIKQPSYESEEKSDYLSVDEIEIVRMSLNPIELLATDYMLVLALRRSMVLNLSPSNFNFDEKTLTIPKNMPGNKSNKTWKDKVPDFLIHRAEQYILLTGLVGKMPLFRVYYIAERTGRGRPPGDSYHESYIIAPSNIPEKEGYIPYANQPDAFTKFYTEVVTDRVGFYVHPHLFKHTAGTWFYELTKDVAKTARHLKQKKKESAWRYTNMMPTTADIKTFTEHIGVV
jgi:integrase